MTKYGYLRVSTRDQSLDRQIHGLRDICDELHVEYLSAVSRRRPVFEALRDRLEHGDTLVVWDLDRAFRSTTDAITEAEKLRARGVNFQVVSLNVDTGTADGMFVYTVVAALAQHERMRISERTKQGLAAARARGVRLGRPRALDDRALTEIKQALHTPGVTIKALAEAHGMAPWSLSRALKRLADSGGKTVR